jgi:Ca2+-transporting ATPase
MDTDELLKLLATNVQLGLPEAEWSARLQEYGPNELVERGLKSPLLILVEQITNPLVLLLIGAAIVSALLGRADSFIAISAIVVINAVLGVVQE